MNNIKLITHTVIHNLKRFKPQVLLTLTFHFWQPNNHFYTSLLNIDLITRLGFRRPSAYQHYSEKIVYSLCLPSVPYINGSCSYLYGTERVWIRNRMKYVILKCFCGVFSASPLKCWMFGILLFICCSVCSCRVFFFQWKNVVKWIF